MLLSNISNKNIVFWFEIADTSPSKQMHFKTKNNNVSIFIYIIFVLTNYNFS